MSTSFSYGTMYITRYEQQGIGLHWNNVWESPMTGDKTNFGIALMFTLFDAILYLCIALTILFLKNNIGESKKLCCWTFQRRRSFPYVTLGSREEEEITKSSSASNRRFSSPQPVKDHDKEVGVSLRGLTKVYRLTNGENKIAVDHLDLDFNVGEVTALLGHNGAGKSTTMKMLTGLEPPTSGQIQIMGHDYPQEWAAIQKLIGFCPQHSILYPDLTAREHLIFYGKLKGALKSQDDITADVDALIESMAMEEAKFQPVKELSEGMQRRVCVALAFIGASKVVVLDEPTAGVDPIARRYIWRLIDQHKAGRVIILTTHHLDEAEILSDRIAVIHMGRLLTLGTLGSLKENFGSGYQLSIALKQSGGGGGGKAIKTALEANIRKLNSRVQTIRKGAKEEIYFLPNEGEGQQPANFIQLMEMLEGVGRANYGVKSFTMTCTTLEDIFMKLVNDANQNSSTVLTPARNEDREETESVTSTEFEMLNVRLREGSGLVAGQLRGLLYKRFKHSHRDWRFLISSFILPAILMVVCLALAGLRPSTLEPPLLLTPNLYGPDSNSYIRFEANSQHNSVLEALLAAPGIGTTCMTDVPNIADYPACLTAAETGFTTDYTGPGFSMGDCDCTDRDWVCAAAASPDSAVAPRWKTATSDTIFDISNANGASVNQWILNTHTEFIDQRFGGWSIANRSDLAGDLGGTKDNLMVWYNNKAPHALPSYLNSIHNARLRSMVTSMNNNASHFGISTYVHPMAITTRQISSHTIVQDITDYGIAFLLLTALSFLPSSLIPYLITERTMEEKQVQKVAGVSTITYWVTAFIWDLMVTFVFVILCGIILQIFQIPSYTANSNFSAMILLLFFYCTASISAVYCLEKLFNEASLGQLTVLCGNILVGIMTILIMVLLEGMYTSQTAQNFKYKINYVFLLLPPYALGDGLLDLANNQIKSEVFAEFGKDAYVQPLYFYEMGRNVMFLGLETILFFALNLALEYRLFSALKRKLQGLMRKAPLEGDGDWIEEDDVRQERLRVQDPSQDSNNILTIRNLTRVFSGWFGKSKIAVNNVSVGIQPGECFGWLGLNGAGKSTTFKMLTGALDKSGGSFHFSGKQTLMGYCPQEQALDQLLTVREMLKVYSLVRGIYWRDSEKVITKAIGDMALENNVNTKCEGLSGGTKRKVCTAIAVMGNPELILMDEPTSGMDVLTRRQVWKIIRREVSSGRSVILTSHSMEECEQLCTRLAIMSSGKFQCLGSPSHLKQKYGKGLTLQLTTSSAADIPICLGFVRANFPEAVNVKCHHHTVTFRISADGGNSSKLSVVYSLLTRNKARLGLINFSANPTTLDEVFINFSERAIAEADVKLLELTKTNVDKLAIGGLEKAL